MAVFLVIWVIRGLVVHNSRLNVVWENYVLNSVLTAVHISRARIPDPAQPE